ncbi:MAG: sulfite exporter TauE/SafE family protein [Actinomycetes bacterium]
MIPNMIGHGLFLLIAGICAGLGGSVAGIGSIYSYPALLLVGLNPLDANVTNSVSLTFVSIGAVIGSKPEWLPKKKLLMKMAPATFIGGICGALLLLSTPVTSLKIIIPYLLIFSSIAVLIPRKSSSSEVTRKRYIFVTLIAGVIGIYCGYFGAGSGSMTIVILMQLLSLEIKVAQAMKNLLIGIANGVAAVAFIFSSHVHWLVAIPLAIGCYIGGRTGPIIVRRMNQKYLKIITAISGLVLATWLLLR